MTEYTENKLSIVFPLRLSPTLYGLLEHQVWLEKKDSNAEFVRECVVDGLKKRGVQIPEPMTCWKKLEMQAEQRESDTQAPIDSSMFPPLS